MNQSHSSADIQILNDKDAGDNDNGITNMQSNFTGNNDDDKDEQDDDVKNLFVNDDMKQNGENQDEEQNLDVETNTAASML